MRIGLAWELGSGLGHARALHAIARALCVRGHEVVLASPQVEAMRLSAGEFELAPTRAMPLTGRTDIASFAEILLGVGYGQTSALDAAIASWRDFTRGHRLDLLVANHAPTALLAARCEGLPAMSIGTGFTCPPRLSPMPPFRSWDPIAPARVRESETTALCAINAALERVGAPPLDRLADAVGTERAALWTLPELDPYGVRTTPSYCGPILEASPDPGSWSAPTQDAAHRVFAYLKWTHPATAALLDSLRQQPELASVVFVAGMPAAERDKWNAANLRLSSTPMALTDALQWASAVICHAGATTVSAALAAGRPLLLLPEVPEQFLTSLAVHGLGAGHWWVPPTGQAAQPAWNVLLQRWLSDTAMHEAAKRFGRQCGGLQPDQGLDRMVVAIESAG